MPKAHALRLATKSLKPSNLVLVTNIIFTKTRIHTFELTKLGATPLFLRNCIDVVLKKIPLNL